MAGQQNANKVEELSMQRGHPTAAPNRAQLFLNALAIEQTTCARIINGVMLPANSIELPIDRLLPAWPDTWHPSNFSVFSWRAITFPIYCLPFWWFAGYGADALFKRRRPRWPTLLTGTLLCTLFALLTIGFCVSPSPYSEPAVNIPLIIGGVLWTVLFATFPSTWLRNGLASRRCARQAT
jgi:hypothetical protein